MLKSNLHLKGLELLELIELDNLRMSDLGLVLIRVHTDGSSFFECLIAAWTRILLKIVAINGPKLCLETLLAIYF